MNLDNLQTKLLRISFVAAITFIIIFILLSLFWFFLTFGKILPRAASIQIDSHPIEKSNPELLLNYVNDMRKENGVSPLKYDLCLGQAANIKAADMDKKGYWDHYDSRGKNVTFDYVLYDCGAYSVGENLAKGFRSYEYVVSGWMWSKSHREIMLSSQYSKIGLTTKKWTYNGDENYLIVAVFSD